MRPLPPLEGLASLTDATLTALRERLAELGYDEGALAEGESIAPAMLDALRLPLLRDAWRNAPTPRRDLALLFTYDSAVEIARVSAALGADLFDALTKAGALSLDGDLARCPFRITPLRGLWIVGDDLNRGGEAVMGPGPTTLQLARAMPTRDLARVLDVGCGAGTLALLASARGASEAVGVDISERAVALSRFNARLNGLSARFEVSDMFSAVAGERFDLIVSQPAFIAHPPDVAASTFAHGGPMGDELVIRLFEGLSSHLAAGGRALVLLDSAVRPKAPLHARLRAALGRSALDLVVLAAKGHDPDTFSIAYASLIDPDLGPAWRDAALRYRAHLRAMGVEEFTHALAAVSTASAVDAGFTITLPVKSLRGFDAEVLSMLGDALSIATRDDAKLLASTVRANPAAVYVEERARPDSALEPRWVVRFTGAEWSDRELTEPTWVLLGLLDAADTVRDAVGAFAEACGATPDGVRAQVLGFVRESLARGLLVAA
ncbi:MAG: methyltransferase [Polyangiales bacterium]